MYSNMFIEYLSFFLDNLDSYFAPLYGYTYIGEEVIKSLEKFVHIEQLLDDDKSKKLYATLLKARLSTLFLDTQHYFSICPLYKTTEWDKYIDTSKKHEIEGDNPLERIQTWILESYTYKGDRQNCMVEEGDVVLDVGAFTGNTTMYFSQLANNEGHVYAFEPSPSTFELLKKNIKKSGLYNTTLIPAAANNKMGTLRFPLAVSGSNKALESDGVEVPSITLDVWFENNNISRVDFIKMAVEGSEENVILGAKNIISNFSPKMVISIYHKVDDFYKIPSLVLSINPNYKLFISHSSNNFYGTCMFFLPSDTPLEIPALINMDSIKNLYATSRELFERRNKELLYERIRMYLLTKHCKFSSSMPFLFVDGQFIIPFSENNDEHFKVHVRSPEVHVALCFHKILVTRDSSFRDLLMTFFKSILPRIPNSKIFSNKSALILYIVVPQEKDEHYLVNNIHWYRDVSESISDNLMILIYETLPFLVDNGIISGEHVFFWRHLALSLKR